MKLTTTLMATLLFASTGAFANTLALTEQEDSLIQEAATIDMRRCAIGALFELRNSEKKAMLNELFRTLNQDLQSMGFESTGADLPSSEQMAIAIMSVCKAKN